MVRREEHNTEISACFLRLLGVRKLVFAASYSLPPTHKDVALVPGGSMDKPAGVLPTGVPSAVNATGAAIFRLLRKLIDAEARNRSKVSTTLKKNHSTGSQEENETCTGLQASFCLVSWAYNLPPINK
jgi:hypothetical protein